jgi:transposase
LIFGTPAAVCDDLVVARSYRPVDREQEFLLPASMLDWLPEDHLVWLLIAAVEQMDTARFHESAKRGGVGRRGYDPDMLLTLLVYAMAHGTRSSRRVEQLCHTDVAFRIICAGDVPDHTVLARFRQRHHEGLTDLLTQTLLLAAELGMVSLGVVAFDGTKIAGDASKAANRSEAHLRELAEQYLAAVAATDATEDELFGEHVRGDEVPGAVRGRDRSGRRARIDAALEQVIARRQADEVERQYAEQAQAQRAERAEAAQRRRAEQAERAATYEQTAVQWGRVLPGRPPAGVDPVAVARARWQRRRARAQAQHAALQARPPRPHRRGARPTPVDEQLVVRRAYAAYQAAAEQAAAEQAAAEQAAAEQAADYATPTSKHGKDTGAEDTGAEDNRDNDNNCTRSGDAGSGRAGSGRAGSGRAGSGRASSGRASSGRASSGRASSGRASSGRASSGRASSGRASRGGRGGEQRQANLTDPDSRLLKTRSGWVQGYNCQTAISADEFILTARATQDANDSEQFVPTVAAVTAIAARLAEHTGRDDLTVGTMLGDAGYDSDANLAAEGPDRLIADAKQNAITRRAAAEPATGDPPEAASPREAMNHRLRTGNGHTLYRRRSAMIEPSNAWIKDGRGLRRFSRRGLAAVQAELSLACAVVNLLKLATKGITPAHLQAL